MIPLSSRFCSKWPDWSFAPTCLKSSQLSGVYILKMDRSRQLKPLQIFSKGHRRWGGGGQLIELERKTATHQSGLVRFNQVTASRRYDPAVLPLLFQVARMPSRFNVHIYRLVQAIVEAPPSPPENPEGSQMPE